MATDALRLETRQQQRDALATQIWQAGRRRADIVTRGEYRAYLLPITIAQAAALRKAFAHAYRDHPLRPRLRDVFGCIEGDDGKPVGAWQLKLAGAARLEVALYAEDEPDF